MVLMKNMVFRSILAALLGCNLVFSQVKVILDTDIGPDWDDVGAVATLHALANYGEAEILAMMVSSGGHSGIWGPPCLDAFNTYYNRPDIPIGVATDGPAFGSIYNQSIAETFPQDLGTGNAWNAVELYRKILSEQPDTSVVIVSTGFLTNLADLLKSESDEYSSLNGIDLVRKKVKRWVCMGAVFRLQAVNLILERIQLLQNLLSKTGRLPSYLAGLRSEVHCKPVRSWPGPQKNPIRKAYELAGGYVGSRHASWDQTAVLAAIRDPLLYWDVESTGYCSVGSNGSNQWKESPDKDHSYLIKKIPDSQLEEVIDDLMANVRELPQVELILPKNKAHFEIGIPIEMEAVASDTNGQIIKVEFFCRSEKIGESTAPPYRMVWKNAPEGGYYLKARAYDDQENYRDSDPVKIYVGEVDTTLIGYWKFENNGSDSSAMGHDGVIHGQPKFVEGRLNGKAIQFNTDQDFISIAPSPDFSLASFTLTAWVKLPSPIPEGWRTIIEHDRGGDNWFGLWKSANGNVFHFRWGASGNVTADFTSQINPNAWYFVAGTFDAEQKTARLYLNGKLDKEIPNADVPFPHEAGLRIGLNMHGQEEFAGIIDEVQIYNRVLQESEIKSLITSTDVELFNGFTPHSFSLINYPNPFNATTTIKYELSSPSHVKIDAFDLSGRKLLNLLDRYQSAGTYTIKLDGAFLSSGVYLIRLKTDQKTIVKKIILTK